MANKNVPVKAKQTTQKEPVGEYRCSCCGVIYNKRQGNYFKSGSPLYAGNEQYINICKNCTNDYYKQLLGFYNGDSEKAIRRCCELLDVYYSDNVFAATGKEATDSRISLYLSKLNMAQFKTFGKTYLDTVAEELNKPRVIEEVYEDDAEIYEPTAETIKLFGEGYSREDYQFLEEEYKDWIASQDEINKEQKELTKVVVFAQLAVREAAGSKNIKELEKATKVFRDSVTIAGLKPKSQKDISNIQKITGMFAKQIETTRPNPAPKPEYADVDGFDKYVTFLADHVNKIVGGQLVDENSYNERINKHSLTSSALEEDFSDE